MFQKRYLAMGLVTIVVGLLAVLAVLEIGLRLFYPQPIGVSSHETGGIPLHTPNYDFHYKTDEFDIRTRFNSMGLRDKDYSLEKPDGIYRIVVLGDSITEALQVKDDEVYTEVLEASLNAVENATTYEVLNLGMSGFGTADQLALWSDLGERLEADSVIVQMSLINDLSESLYCRWLRIDEEGQILPRQEFAKGWMGGLGEFVGRYSHLAQLLRHALRSQFGSNADRLEHIDEHKERYHALLYANKGSEFDFRDDWETTFLYLRKLRERVIRSDAGFLLLVRPLDPDVEGARDSLYPRDILFEFCGREEIEYLDLTPIFAEKSGGDILQVRFKIDSHWIPQAHRWAAESLLERFKDL
jgi:lysophospholipase L1-like esterase